MLPLCHTALLIQARTESMSTNPVSVVLPESTVSNTQGELIAVQMIFF